MISEQLLKILVCPVTHQHLNIADPKLIERINCDISEGQVKDNAGKTVAESLQSGLVREDGKILYPIRDDIPVLLADEGIPL
jgi:uncharacterized protein